MHSAGNEVAARGATTLTSWGVKPIVIQVGLLLSAAVLLPAIAHLLGLPVRRLLPMHWAVLLAGLVYGWRSGLLIGVSAPGLSHLLNGMPALGILPAMSVELAVYGFLAGLFREVFRLNHFVSIGLALVVGRIAFVITATVTGGYTTSLATYLQAAMLPGALAAVAQFVILPLIALLWVGRGNGAK
jgi:hypothetical protein